MAKVDRYAVNDTLTALAERFGVTLPDDVLNELTHHVSDVIEDADKLRAGERVRDDDGQEGTVYTDEAGGFVRVTFDRYANDPLMTDTLVDVSKLRRV